MPGKKKAKMFQDLGNYGLSRHLEMKLRAATEIETAVQPVDDIIKHNTTQPQTYHQHTTNEKQRINRTE